jgi:predicted nucleotide-binding protein (sugar kinase/HSP70/actin superfamily)
MLTIRCFIQFVRAESEARIRVREWMHTQTCTDIPSLLHEFMLYLSYARLTDGFRVRS